VILGLASDGRTPRDEAANPTRAELRFGVFDTPRPSLAILPNFGGPI
jgi:hypothetical protein